MSIEINCASTATILGIFTSAAMFGGSMASTQYAIPGLLKPFNQPPVPASKSDPQPVTLSSRHVAQQWRELFFRGATGGPTLTGIATISWLYVAWNIPAGKQLCRNLYVAGAITAISVLPFTRAFMMPSIYALLRHADGKEIMDGSEQNDQSVDSLLKTWSKWALARGCIPIAGICMVLAANVV